MIIWLLKKVFRFLKLKFLYWCYFRRMKTVIRVLSASLWLAIIISFYSWWSIWCFKSIWIWINLCLFVLCVWVCCICSLMCKVVCVLSWLICIIGVIKIWVIFRIRKRGCIRSRTRDSFICCNLWMFVEKSWYWCCFFIRILLKWSILLVCINICVCVVIWLRRFLFWRRITGKRICFATLWIKGVWIICYLVCLFMLWLWISFKVNKMILFCFCWCVVRLLVICEMFVVWSLRFRARDSVCTFSVIVICFLSVLS